VRDALGPQLPGWLHKLGVEVIATQYVSDELNLVIDAFARAAKNSDIVFTTGGTADGPRDHVHAAIAELKGELIVDRVKVRPGHPMLLAHINNVPLVGLPGNPQSAIVALLTLGQPVIDALMGRKEVELNQIVTGDDIDVPEELRSTSAPPKENEYDTDANHFARWDWVMDEMIFAFEYQLKDTTFDDIDIWEANSFG
jgi:molybdopterin molybdotransferase